MNLPIEQFIPSGGVLVTGLAGFVTFWFKMQNKVDNLEAKDNKQEERIEDIIKWSHDHEKDAAKAREEFTKELSKLEGANLVVSEQFKQIMSMLTEIKERISNLESRKN
jgi:seryl-tRNA synthetase